MAETKEIVHILNTHFPANWSNENLRERVIEFGEDVWKQASSDLLEALKAILEGEYAHYIPSKLFDPAMAAIRKAEGK